MEHRECRSLVKRGIGGLGWLSAAVLLVGVTLLFCLASTPVLLAPAWATVDVDAPRDPGDRSIDTYLSNPDRSEVVAGEVLVAFKRGVNALTAGQMIDRYGAVIERVLPLTTKYGGGRVAVVKSRSALTASFLEQLRANPAIAMVSPNFRQSAAATLPNDPDFAYLWGLDNTGQTGGVADSDIDAPEAWDLSTGSPNVVVADIDSGIDYTHEDLVANVWVNSGEIPADGLDNDLNGYVDDVYGIDTAYWDSDPWDDNGHGTHTAGTIAAVGDNGLGITGVAWSTKVMALKFLDEWGYGSDAAAIEAIYYVIDQKVSRGVDVVAINASWGGGGYDPLLEQAIADAGEAGIVFVAAAGNDSWNTDAIPDYPACFDVPTIVSVGASDHGDYPSWFSNYGSATVDLFAPGESIWSTVPDFDYTPAPGDLFFDGMESGAALWATVEGTWGITSEQAYDGTYSWSDSPGGDYTDGLDVSLATVAMDLTTGPAHPVFGFSTRYMLGLEGWDMLLVEFSGDGGGNWENYMTILGSSWGSWESYCVPIPWYLITDQFQARFRLVTDDGDGATYDGVYLDDVGVGSTAGSDVYDWMSGTSMAAPHVTGALAVLAAEYPADSALERISRVRSGVDVLPQLAGLCGTGGRLNLAGAVDPGLVPGPWVTALLYDRPVVEGSALTIEGVLFGGDEGRVLLSDGIDEVEASVVSWSDNLVEATMPGTRNAMVILERADSERVVAGRLSAWADLEPSIIARDGNSASTYAGDIYSFGGYTQGGWLATNMVEYYHPATGVWQAVSSLRLPAARVYAASVEVGGRLYVIGGYDDTYDQAFSNNWAYDTISGSWLDLAPLPHRLMFHEAVVLDGLIWVFGGCDETGAMNPDLYVYDPGVDSWTVMTGPPKPRVEGAGVVLGGRIFLCGGLDLDTGEYLGDTTVYDASTDTWSAGPDMPFPLARMGVAECGGKAYLIGGTDTDWWLGGTGTVLRLDPSTDSWADMSPTIAGLPERSAVHSSPAVSLPGVGLYSLNGMVWEGSSSRTQRLSQGVFDVTIGSLAPAQGPTTGGTVVTIAGTNFYDVTDVTFGGVPATGYTVASSTEITATSPAHGAGPVQVQVTTLEGTTADSEADDFVYQVVYTSLRGTDRYDTAIRISQAAFTAPLPSGSGLVLAPGETYQEALCGAPLAAAYGGPVLLTPSIGLNNAVRAEIQRLKPTYVVLIGLSDTVKNAVQSALGASGAASVIRGSSVYDMSYRVANALDARVGSLSTATAIITRGDKFPDAISVSPLACSQKWPVLLTGGTTGLSISATRALGELGIKKAIKVGTYATLPATVTGLANLSGADRYHTCANVAEWALANAGHSFAHTGITTGDKFPDALAAGPYLAQQRGVVLLSPLYGPLPQVVSTRLAAHAEEVYHVTFFATIEPVVSQVKALLP